MNWLDKVRKLLDLKRNKKPGEPRIDISPCKPSWETNELEELCHEFPWLPQAYLDYIKEFDSTSITFCNFFGSNKCDGLFIKNQLQEFTIIVNNDYFPFAKDADGSIFLLNTKGQVLLWDKYDYSFEEEPELIAETFEEFMGDCLLGKRIGEFITPGKNSFYKTIQQLGWV